MSETGIVLPSADVAMFFAELMVLGFLVLFRSSGVQKAVGLWLQNPVWGCTPCSKSNLFQLVSCRPFAKKGLVFAMEDRSDFNKKYPLKQVVVF